MLPPRPQPPAPSRRPRALASLLASVALAGCDPGEGLEPACELGTGEIEFEPVDDGDTMLIIQGPQGGFHLLGSVRVHGVDPGDREDLSSPDNPTTSFDVQHGGSSVLLTGDAFVQGLQEGAEPPFTHSMMGRFAVLDIAADDELVGETVVFSVSVSDVEGVVVSDAVTVDLEAHPFNN